MTTSDMGLEDKVLRLIETLEEMPVLDFELLGKASGLGSEAEMIYKGYVAGKGLLAKAFVNFFRLGLLDSFVLVHVTPAVHHMIPKITDYVMRSDFAISSFRSMGEDELIFRVLVPSGREKEIEEGLNLLQGEGLVNRFEVCVASQAPNRYSFHPSVFDYASGVWKADARMIPVARKIRKFDVSRVDFDETDLKILHLLKRSSAIGVEAMSEALALDKREVRHHLEEHVLGGGDPSRSMVIGSFLDFFDPGVFAPQTLTIAGIFWPEEGFSSLFLAELVENAYLTFFSACDSRYFTLFYLPPSSLHQFAVFMDEMESRYASYDFRYYLSHWSWMNKYGDPKNPADISRQYVNGEWRFNAQEMFSGLKRLVQQGAGATAGLSGGDGVGGGAGRGGEEAREREEVSTKAERLNVGVSP